MSMMLTIIAAVLSAGLLVVLALRVSIRMTDSKTNQQVAAQMKDGSSTNHDSSSGMWADCGDGGGD
jgi:hypothetical protein